MLFVEQENDDQTSTDRHAIHLILMVPRMFPFLIEYE